MKILFSHLLVLSVSVSALLGADLSRRSSAEAEQKFSSLPIGYNLDGYISSIRVDFGTDENSQKEVFRYNRQYDGALETFAAAKLREIASRFVPKAGQETAPHGWSIDAITYGIGGLLPNYDGESKPSVIAVAYPPDDLIPFYLTLRNNRWEVPEEVFGKVRFDFPWGIPFYIPDAKHLKVNLYGPNGRVARFSTKEKISDADNPCELPAITDLLRMGIVTIPTAIVIAEKGVWWNRAEVIVLTEAEETTFESYYPPTPKDGKAIRWSNPPPSFFTPPAPQITSLKRVGDVTEIAVENPGAFVLEFSENFQNWRKIDGSEIRLTSETQPAIIRHQTEAANGFYRLRQKDGAQ